MKFSKLIVTTGLVLAAFGAQAGTSFNDNCTPVKPNLPNFFPPHNTPNEPVHVSAVPEPETYAMLLAGLALIGTIARRRNKVKAI